MDRHKTTSQKTKMDNSLEPMPGPNVFEMHEVIQQAGKPEDPPEDSSRNFITPGRTLGSTVRVWVSIWVSILI